MKEQRAERWRAKYRKANSSPFSALPGMQGRVESGGRTPPVVSEDERRELGLASRGSRSTLGVELATHVLELRAEGQSYQKIAAAVGCPQSTIRHWVVSGRAAAVSKGRGQTN